MSDIDPELERLTTRRSALAHRLNLIAMGAKISYADGTPIDMANEKARLEDEVKRLDRKILALQPPAGRA